jgi:predicted ATPase/DNA-binding winged helix-turn-helix (wHTH) protein
MGAGPYRFGRFALDPAERRLSANGVPVPLGETPFQILLMLVENGGDVVGKDDLISRVWGHAAVGDNRLHVHMNALRRIVGDECIATKQGRGYRLTLKVRSAGETPVQPIAKAGGGNLPALWTAKEGPTRLIGRQQELATISERLGSSRIVTLTGPGGVGKTRLAVLAASQNAGRFADGVWLVELAVLSDAELIPATIAAVVGVKTGHAATPLETLARHLARKSLLLVLDNCEHLTASVARTCETLLSAAPSVHILATSREALTCAGETILPVPPLDVPPEGQTDSKSLRAMPAVELFTERATNVSASFRMSDKDVATVARICRRLDGLPLAIEMVAGWGGLMGVESLEAEFQGPATSWVRAGHTVPPRHATLRATLEWSYALLSDIERVVLRGIAVFPGGFTLQAAKAVLIGNGVAQDDLFACIASLIRKSMIAKVPDAQRHRLLGTTRAFMLQKLSASGESDVLRRRHAMFVLETLRTASEDWESTGDADWVAQYGSLVDDLRAALGWAMQQNAEPEVVIALAGASWPLWHELSLRTEGQHWLSDAAKQLRHDTPPALEAQLRRGLGDVLSVSGAVKAAHAELTLAADIYRALGARHDLGGTLANLGYTSLSLNFMEKAEACAVEACAILENVGRPRTLAMAYSTRITIETRLGHTEAARRIADKAIRLCEVSGAERAAFVIAANHIEATLETVDPERAVSLGYELVARLRETSYSDILGFASGVTAAALIERGDLDDALVLARESVPLLREHGMLFWLFDHLALRAGLEGRLSDGALLAGYATDAHRRFERPRERIGARAIERLMGLLRATLSEREMAELVQEGAGLTEEQALALALRP